MLSLILACNVNWAGVPGRPLSTHSQTDRHQAKNQGGEVKKRGKKPQQAPLSLLNKQSHHSTPSQTKPPLRSSLSPPSSLSTPTSSTT
ncbi:hypothetical protein IE53DRAFT_386424 [Violaceomyces palustris]|uniref:Uncharacterized protein n=1 Tax=Violaceomyces palustris TaxID=1673888 RepID=A0ACD0NZE0_9BASI|nr:hypothetical protein IE53DRAFT_386424 [Violaceomyces palustris]